MKKLILSAMLLLVGMAVQAQNVQLHYDFGSSLRVPIPRFHASLTSARSCPSLPTLSTTAD